MSWKELLALERTVIAPWAGSSILTTKERTWDFKARPREHGWYLFTVFKNEVISFEKTDPDPTVLCKPILSGYLVGDRLITDETAKALAAKTTVEDVLDKSTTVHLIDEGLDRFVRVSAAKLFPGLHSHLFFVRQEMGSEVDDLVLSSFLSESPIDTLKGVPPALEAAFNIEAWRRAEAARRRAEIERKRREEQERIEKEARIQRIMQSSATSVGRRELAKEDFEAAARAALSVAGAALIDYRWQRKNKEAIVRFRLDGRSYECVCFSETLQIIDAGICLSHTDRTTTLESLPAIIREGDRIGRLVIFRHVN
jgi:hypothetical protein